MISEEERRVLRWRRGSGCMMGKEEGAVRVDATFSTVGNESGQGEKRKRLRYRVEM